MAHRFGSHLTSNEVRTIWYDTDVSGPQSRGVNLSTRPVLALDLGGTRTRTAVVAADGSVQHRREARTPIADGPDAVVRVCAELLRASRDAAPRELRRRLAGVGISAPGPVDPRAGVVTDPPNLGPRFRDVPLAAAAAAATGLPAALDRDTNVAALAERAYGAARGCRDFVYVTVSTGIGGSIVADGRLLHGPDGTAGEIGHLPVALDGPLCGCGASGHLEAVASGVALARDARAAMARGASPFLATRAAAVGADALEARDVAAGEDAGDATCSALMDRARRAFVAVVVGLVDVFNPEAIVVGGAIADAQGERLLGPARAEVARVAFRAPALRVRIVPAALGADVALVGALPLVALHLASGGDPGDPSDTAGTRSRDSDPANPSHVAAARMAPPDHVPEATG